MSTTKRHNLDLEETTDSVVVQQPETLVAVSTESTTSFQPPVDDRIISIEDFVASKNLQPRVREAIVRWYKNQGLTRGLRSHLEGLFKKVM